MYFQVWLRSSCAADSQLDVSLRINLCRPYRDPHALLVTPGDTVVGVHIFVRIFIHIIIHIFHNFIFTSRTRIKSPGMGCASSKAANPVVATPQIPPNKVQGYEAQTIGLKRGAHETAAALPSDTPATNVSRGSEVLKLQSKSWYKNDDGTQAVCTILKVHYDDNTAILYDR